MSRAPLCLSFPMTFWRLVLPVMAVLSGCAVLTGRAPGSGDPPAQATEDQVPSDLGPAGGMPPPGSARTVAEFDTTTPEEQAAAQAVPEVGGERGLGTTIASLGSPSEPGFWLKTPLVQDEVSGRVVFSPTGRSVQVTLFPIDGPATAGSRISLPAMRLLDAPLTGLVEVEVYARR